MNKEVKDWSQADLKRYMIEQNLERFNEQYKPFISWGAEGKLMKQAFELYDPIILKEWVDRVFFKWSPSEKFKTLSFGFIFKYRLNDLEELLKQREQSEEVEPAMLDESEVAKWFES